MEISAILASLSATEITATSVMVAVFVMIVTGKLVPEKLYNELRERADGWKEAHDEEREMRRDLMRELRVAKETGQTIKRISKALRDQAPLEGDEPEEESEDENESDDENPDKEEGKR